MKNKFLFYTFITLFFFGILFKLEFATDTYAVFNFDKEEVFTQYAMSGRFITGIVFKVFKLINISENTMYLLSFILAIFCASMSQYVLYKLIDKDIKSSFIKQLIPTLIVINPFSIELFLFIEKGIMWFGVLMCILGIKNIIEFFETMQKKYIFFSIVLMFLANCSYQGVVGIFVAILLVYILKYSKSIQDFLINNAIVGSVYAIPAMIDFLLVKLLLKSSRINGQIVVIDSIKKILKNILSMTLKMFGILPKYVFILLILFTFAVLCSKIWKERKILHVLKFVYIIVGIILISILPQFIQPTNSIWFVPRVTYSFASMYGILILYLTMNYDLKNNFTLIVSIVIIIVQLQTFIKIENDRYVINQKDENIAMQIIEQINNYEMKTRNKITKVSLYQDKNPNYTYEGIFATGDMNIKSFYVDWSALEILKYYSKKELKLVEKDEDLEQQFKQKDWSEFNIEQIVFEKNIINICNY